MSQKIWEMIRNFGDWINGEAKSRGGWLNILNPTAEWTDNIYGAIAGTLEGWSKNNKTGWAKAGFVSMLIAASVNIVANIYSNFNNPRLSITEKWMNTISDTSYIVMSTIITYGVSSLVAKIPVVGLFIAPFADLGVSWLLDMTRNIDTRRFTI